MLSLARAGASCEFASASASAHYCCSLVIVIAVVVVAAVAVVDFCMSFTLVFRCTRLAFFHFHFASSLFKHFLASQRRRLTRGLQEVGGRRGECGELRGVENCSNCIRLHKVVSEMRNKNYYHIFATLKMHSPNSNSITISIFPLPASMRAAQNSPGLRLDLRVTFVMLIQLSLPFDPLTKLPTYPLTI